jgi:anaerobic magnesium-protoporphyrin IX monomethyl ester cyclase
MIDILFINPGDRKTVFQDLGKDLTAIEPPFQIASYASLLRNEGYNVAIIDANAENISPEETAQKIKELNPLLVAVIVYGNQPSASTQNMAISGRIITKIKKFTNSKVVIGGLHPSALPKRTLEEENADFVIEGEEQIPLKELLEYLNGNRKLNEVSGIWYYENNKIKNNPKPPLIKDLDKYLPIAAWDLLPMEKYRAHNWHCFDDIENRSPYGAIYTSLGCPYKCTFCCINAPFGGPGIRYRSPKLVVEEIELLNKKYGIKNIKIIDEMFVLDERHYMKIVDLLIEKNLDLNIWAYARVDTVHENTLKKMKKAGFNWLALGIESASADVRDGASKKMRVKDIESIVRKIQNEGIRVIGNYIFGLPDDTLESMQETLDMAKALNCEFANFYCAMAYPGSQLYNIALDKGWELPKEWIGYSQHSYNIQPLPSKNVSAKDIVAFRDNAFHEYNENPRYLDMLKKEFGQDVKGHMEEITKTRLKRKILGDKNN